MKGLLSIHVSLYNVTISLYTEAHAYCIFISACTLFTTFTSCKSPCDSNRWEKGVSSFEDIKTFVYSAKRVNCAESIAHNIKRCLTILKTKSDYWLLIPHIKSERVNVKFIQFHHFFDRNMKAATLTPTSLHCTSTTQSMQNKFYL